MQNGVIITYCNLSMLQINKFGVTEHIEGDECKFALWEGTVAPISDNKIILRVSYSLQFQFSIFGNFLFLLFFG